MLKKRNVSQEIAIQNACKKNGLKYNPYGNNNEKTIRVECEDGNIRKYDINLNNDESENLKYRYAKPGFFSKSTLQIKLESTPNTQSIHFSEPLVTAKANKSGVLKKKKIK